MRLRLADLDQLTEVVIYHLSRFYIRSLDLDVLHQRASVHVFKYSSSILETPTKIVTILKIFFFYMLKNWAMGLHTSVAHIWKLRTPWKSLNSLTPSWMQFEKPITVTVILSQILWILYSITICKTSAGAISLFVYPCNSQNPSRVSLRRGCQPRCVSLCWYSLT